MNVNGQFSNKLSLVPAISYEQIKDKSATNILHQGIVPVFNLSFEKKNLKWNYNFEISYCKFKIFNRYGFPATTLQVQFSNDYVKEVINKNNMMVYIGPYISVNYSLQHYTPLIHTHFYWQTIYDLGFMSRYKFSVIENFPIWGYLSISAIGAISRNPEERYYRSDWYTFDYILPKIHEEVKFMSYPTYYRLTGSINYNVYNCRKINLAIGYAFEYIKILEPTEFKKLINQFNIYVYYEW